MELYLKVFNIEVVVSGKCAEIKIGGNIVFEKVGKLFCISNEVQ